MSSMGATVIRDTDFKEFDPEGDQRENLSFNVMLREGNPSHADGGYEDADTVEIGIESYFKSLKENPHNVHSLSDLVQFMHDTPEEQVVKYGVEGFVEARDEPYTSESREFKEAVERMKFLGADIERLLDAVEADAIVAPTSADLPFDLGQNPVVTVPLGYFSENRRVAKALDGMIAKANNVP
jgi:amidase